MVSGALKDLVLRSWRRNASVGHRVFICTPVDNQSEFVLIITSISYIWSKFLSFIIWILICVIFVIFVFFLNSNGKMKMFVFFPFVLVILESCCEIPICYLIQLDLQIEANNDIVYKTQIRIGLFLFNRHLHVVQCFIMCLLWVFRTQVIDDILQ